MHKNKKGFTLVEILIVVAIIGILSSVALVGLGPLQKKGRDTRRLADMRSLQAALEIYFANNSKYPAATGDDISTLKTAVSPSIVKSFPVDPLGGRKYHYWTDANGTVYVLGADLEEPTNTALVSGITDATAASIGINGTGCGVTSTTSGLYCVTL